MLSVQHYMNNIYSYLVLYEIQDVTVLDRLHTILIVCKLYSIQITCYTYITRNVSIINQAKSTTTFELCSKF